MRPKYIILHHSLTKDGQTVSWDAIRRYHTQQMQWRDIGYHFGIERIGKRYEILVGRMMNDPGAHCIGMNGNSIGICFVGNFDNVSPPAEQWDLGVELVRSLMEILEISRENILGHREIVEYKSCPGECFDLNRFRREIKWR